MLSREQRHKRSVWRTAVVVAAGLSFVAEPAFALDEPTPEQTSSAIGSYDPVGEEGVDVYESELKVIRSDQNGQVISEDSATLSLDPLTGLTTPLEGDAEAVMAPSAGPGCNQVFPSVRRQKSYFVVVFTYYRYTQTKAWCYDGRDTIGYSHVDQGYFDEIDPLWTPSGQGVRFASRFNYSGSQFSGHYSKWQERIDNCVPPNIAIIGGVCLKNTPFVEIWSHADGSWRWNAGVN